MIDTIRPLTEQDYEGERGERLEQVTPVAGEVTSNGIVIYILLRFYMLVGVTNWTVWVAVAPTTKELVPTYILEIAIP